MVDVLLSPVANDPGSELVGEVTLPDGTRGKVYKVTPKDDTPIQVDEPGDVLEPSKVSSHC